MEMNWRNKKAVKQPNGYMAVWINRKKKYIHRLLAEEFIPNPNNYKDINHINGIKDDNRIENLEWCTRKQNIQHAFRLGLNKALSGELCKLSKLSEKQVKEIKTTSMPKSRKTARHYGKLFNVSESCIRSVFSGRTWAKA